MQHLLNLHGIIAQRARGMQSMYRIIQPIQYDLRREHATFS